MAALSRLLQYGHTTSNTKGSTQQEAARAT